MEYTNDDSLDVSIVYINSLYFTINFYNWSYCKFSQEKMHLSWLVSNFYEEDICTKQKQSKQNQNK